MNKTELDFLIAALALIIAAILILGCFTEINKADIGNTIPEGEPLHPGGYTFPEEVLEKPIYTEFPPDTWPQGESAD